MASFPWTETFDFFLFLFSSVRGAGLDGAVDRCPIREDFDNVAQTAPGLQETVPDLFRSTHPPSVLFVYRLFFKKKSLT